MMKILHIVESLHRGGLERVVVDLAVFQKNQMNTVNVVCIADGGLLLKELCDENIFTAIFRRKEIGTLRVLRGIRNTITKIKPDIIHTHNPIANYFTVLATLGLPNIKIINTRHGMGTYWRSKKGKILYLLSQFNTKYVVSVCETANNIFIKNKNVVSNKACTVRNGIDYAKYIEKNHESKETLCKIIGIPSSSIILGTVGRLNFVKNQKLLIEVMNCLKEIQDSLVLVIVGDGELRKDLEDKVLSMGLVDRVFLIGDREDVNTLLPGMDMFVLPSISEGFSIALLEACASALPIIASNVGGNPEIIRHKINGLLFDPSSVDDLILCLNILLQDIQEAKKMGQKAREWVFDSATLTKMCDAYNGLYSTVL